MTTLAQEIARKYLALQHKLKNELGADVFPALGQVDSTDIVILVCQFFSSSYKKDYRPTIISLARLRGINVDTNKLDTVYPDVAEFLDWTIEQVRNRK